MKISLSPAILLCCLSQAWGVGFLCWIHGLICWVLGAPTSFFVESLCHVRVNLIPGSNIIVWEFADFFKNVMGWKRWCQKNCFNWNSHNQCHGPELSGIRGTSTQNLSDRNKQPGFSAMLWIRMEDLSHLLSQHGYGICKCQHLFNHWPLVPTWSLTARPWKVAFPIGKDRLPTTVFQGLY